MTETSRYLSILAKVMRNKSLPGEGQNREKYNRLYYLIHSELHSRLQKSMYPHTSDIIQRTEDMLNAIEPLYLCPEVVGKQCLWVSCHITTNMFGICKSLFVNQDYVLIFKKIFTQIPFVVVDTDSDDSVEIINFANIRIPLSVSELKFLIIESGRRKVALNKIIQFVIVNTKLKESSLCIIADNVYSKAEKIFSRVISGRLVYVDEKGLETIKQRRIDLKSSLLMSDDVFTNTVNDSYINKFNRVLFTEIDKFIKDEVKPVLCGFWEEYTSIETQILDYYDNQLMQSKEILQDVVGDIVRIGDSGDNTLQSIRLFEESREKKLKTEQSSIAGTLKSIDELVIEISSELGETLITGKTVPRRIVDDIFTSFFRCKGYNSGLGKKLLSRLYSYEYDNYDLVTAYVQANAGERKNFDLIDIDHYEWEKAKMLIDLLDPEMIPNNKLSMYIYVLGDYCNTGKELFAKALISSEGQREEILQKSLRKGYKKAGTKLIEMYKNKYYEINLQTLANALVPEACMILADRNMAKYQSRRHTVDLSDREFTYYKIAAANQYLPAIGKIIDEVFNSEFSSGFQIPADDVNSSKYERMINNGHLICQLCNFLIGKMYQADHYSEIRGIVLFCLNEDLSGAMSLLTNSTSALALYCKGNMYEFGGGVAVNLDQAINHYKLSLKQRYSKRAEKRLEACKQKQSKLISEAKSNNYYQPSRSYHSSTTYTGSTTVDDGCFAPETKILMADGSYCNVEKIKINDSVWVYDHYSGKLCIDRIVANVHENADESELDTVELVFEKYETLTLVKSHALFSISENQYVWINKENAEKYIGDSFAYFTNEKIIEKKLIGYSAGRKKTKYYMPISRYHLNIFAEGILTIPPTKMTVNMFKCKEYMRYDISTVQQYGMTRYEDIKQIVSYEEYVDLPCQYLQAVCETKNLSINDFAYIINLYREQYKYRKMSG